MKTTTSSTTTSKSKPTAIIVGQALGVARPCTRSTAKHNSPTFAYGPPPHERTRARSCKQRQCLEPSESPQPNAVAQTALSTVVARKQTCVGKRESAEHTEELRQPKRRVVVGVKLLEGAARSENEQPQSNVAQAGYSGDADANVKREQHAEKPRMFCSAGLKRLAFERILRFLTFRLDIGLDAERVGILRYLEGESREQGLLVVGSDPQSSSTIVRSLLRVLGDSSATRHVGVPANPYDAHCINCELYENCETLYGSIRSRLRCTWKLPPWRRINFSMWDDNLIPCVSGKSTSVLVLENIDVHVKAIDRKQLTLERLLCFLNALVRFRRLRLIVIGHEPKTIRRFSTQFGGFTSPDVDQYILRLPRYSYTTLTMHIEAVISCAVAPILTNEMSFDDLFAPKALQLIAQKALKHGKCELDPVVAITRRVILKMLRECQYRTPSAKLDARDWRVRYDHVTTVTNEYFKHDYVHRIQCVGVIPQAVLLVLIDSGPCTADELLKRVWHRQRSHSWIMVVAMFRDTMFDRALDLLLAVPLIVKRPVQVTHGSRSRTDFEYVALPSREHLVQAAGKNERISLIL